LRAGILWSKNGGGENKECLTALEELPDSKKTLATS